MRRRTLFTILFFFCLWSAISGLSLIDHFVLATPWDITRSTYELTASGQLPRNLLFTMTRCILSFLISVLIGVPLGISIGWSKRLREYLSFPLEFFRVLPAPVLFPLFLVFFGIGNSAKIAGTVFACAFPVIIQSAYGVLHSNHRRILLMERMGCTRAQLFYKVIYPMALPYIFVGLRNALSLALVATIVVEMTMPGSDGLGYATLNSYHLFRIPDMYAYILTTGIAGWFLNFAFLKIEHRQLYWL